MTRSARHLATFFMVALSERKMAAQPGLVLVIS
jgi:hypothetical protein